MSTMSWAGYSEPEAGWDRDGLSKVLSDACGLELTLCFAGFKRTPVQQIRDTGCPCWPLLLVWSDHPAATKARVWFRGYRPDASMGVFAVRLDGNDILRLAEDHALPALSPQFWLHTPGELAITDKTFYLPVIYHEASPHIERVGSISHDERRHLVHTLGLLTVCFS